MGQTGGAEMDNPLTPTNPEIYGVNGGITDTHQPFISGNSNPIPSTSKTNVLNEGNPDIMDIMECRQRKEINEYNQEAIVGKFINVPIEYMDNMGSSLQPAESEFQKGTGGSHVSSLKVPKQRFLRTKITRD